MTLVLLGAAFLVNSNALGLVLTDNFVFSLTISCIHSSLQKEMSFQECFCKITQLSPVPVCFLKLSYLSATSLQFHLCLFVFHLRPPLRNHQSNTLHRHLRIVCTCRGYITQCQLVFDHRLMFLYWRLELCCLYCYSFQE